jgi:hypothetical protein
MCNWLTIQSNPTTIYTSLLLPSFPYVVRKHIYNIISNYIATKQRVQSLISFLKASESHSIAFTIPFYSLRFKITLIVDF